MGSPLHHIPSDQMITELATYATEVFGDADAARYWLDTPLSELQNLTPRQAATRTTTPILQDAKDVLLRIEYGVYS